MLFKYFDLLNFGETIFTFFQTLGITLFEKLQFAKAKS